MSSAIVDLIVLAREAGAITFDHGDLIAATGYSDAGVRGEPFLVNPWELDLPRRFAQGERGFVKHEVIKSALAKLNLTPANNSELAFYAAHNWDRNTPVVALDSAWPYPVGNGRSKLIGWLYCREEDRIMGLRTESTYAETIRFLCVNIAH